MGGSLFDYWASQQSAGVCVELRVLEQEDDREDLSDILFVATPSSVCWFWPRVSEDLVESPKLDIRLYQQAAHCERGPPSWALAVA